MKKRIYQIIEDIKDPGIVRNDVIALNSMLNELGYETKICAEEYAPGCIEEAVYPFSDALYLDSGDLAFIHISKLRGNAIVKFAGLNCLKGIVYHGITSPSFYKHYNEKTFLDLLKAQKRLVYLSDKVQYCIADSTWAKSELKDIGYECPIDVVPLALPFDAYKEKPFAPLLKRESRYRGSLVLSIGHIAPEKRCEDAIRMFAYYKRHFDHNAHLVFVGIFKSMDPYYVALRKYIDLLNVEGIVFAGQVEHDRLLAYYLSADVLLCQSEYEGFCVPLVEAMLFDLPIVAYDSTAIGETLGGAGALLDTKDPRQTAAVVDRVVRDGELRSAMVQRGRCRLEDFEYGSIKQKFAKNLVGFLKGTDKIER